MSYGEIGNETYIRVFQQYFNKYPNPPSNEHKIKLQEKLKEFDQKIKEYLNENPITKRTLIQKEIYPKELTNEEITTYLVYSLVTADKSRVKSSLETISRKSFNIKNWLKHTQCTYQGQLYLNNGSNKFDRAIKKYREWRNQLENAFKALRLGDLIIFGKYSGTPKKGYTLRGRDYISTANNANECRWSTEIMQTVFAIIRTKLKKDALEVFDSEIATINCYFRSNLDNANDLKDAENYPIKGISYLQAPNFFGGNYMYLVERIPKNIAQQITLTTPIPNNEEDFFRRADSLFRATRVTMDIVEKSKNEKTNHYSQRTQRINNVQTEQPQKGKCYSCEQIGHFVKECPKRKGKEAYNR
ncbi:126_t:CDS:2, partial [Dentiscutata erythropus]